MTTTVFNTKFSEAENKISNVSNILKRQIMMLKYLTLKENISLLLNITNLRVTYLIQR